jgi:hypothetical protein
MRSCAPQKGHSGVDRDTHLLDLIHGCGRCACFGLRAGAETAGGRETAVKVYAASDVVVWRIAF